MESELVKITPAKARQWLKLNTNNRPIRTTHVDALIAAFARGEYKTTHQGIAFDRNMRLLDGQHRLHAIAAMPDDFVVEMLVTTGLNREAVFPVIDTCLAVRSTSDALGLDRRISEVANFLAYIVLGSRSKITPQFVRPVAEFIQPEVEELIKYCNSSARIWSSAPVRAAAAIRMKLGDADYAVLTYRALVTADFDDMSKSAQALYRAFAKAPSSRYDLFARCLKVFDSDKHHLSKIAIRDLTSELEEARDLLRDAFRKPLARVNISRG